MGFEKNEFKFPDEVEESPAAEQLEIEIVDDVPEEDRKASPPMPKEIVEKLDNDDLEEFSKEAKEKILQSKKIYHDERRAKEQALREAEEAFRVSQKLLEENRLLKSKLTEGEKTLLDTSKENVNRALEDAKRQYKEAYDSGDADRLVEAQEKLTEAKLKARDVELYKPQYTEEALQRQETGVQDYQPQQRLDPKTQEWLAKNEWYGKDEVMSSMAMGLDIQLKKQGVPPGSDHYWSVIDSEMRKRFPEKFSDEVDVEIKPSAPEAKPSKKPSTVVAPATRSTGSKKIKLTPTQLALAKKYNLTPEQYAREVMKLENQNG